MMYSSSTFQSHMGGVDFSIMSHVTPVAPGLGLLMLDMEA